MEEYVGRLAIGTYKVDIVDTKNVVLDGIKHNIRRIDTANLYKNESEVGLALKEVKRDYEIEREELHITTKIHPRYTTAKKAKVSIDRSLESLDSYVDTLLIHRPDVWGQDPSTFDKHIQDTWKIMEEYHTSGIVRKMGISNFTDIEIEKLMEFICEEGLSKPFINQICLNEFKFPTKETIDCCKKYDIKIETYSPFGGVGGPLISDENKPIDLLKKRLEVADYVVFGGCKEHSVKSLF